MRSSVPSQLHDVQVSRRHHPGRCGVYERAVHCIKSRPHLAATDMSRARRANPSRSGSTMQRACAPPPPVPLRPASLQQLHAPALERRRLSDRAQEQVLPRRVRHLAFEKMIHHYQDSDPYTRPEQIAEPRREVETRTWTESQLGKRSPHRTGRFRFLDPTEKCADNFEKLGRLRNAACVKDLGLQLSPAVPFITPKML
jgi:hypothetical protein